MNGLNRTSLLAGLVVAFLALLSSAVLAEESAVNTAAIEAATSFDQKYLLPDYIAYSGAESIAEQALAMRTAASFDANFLTPGSIVYNAGNFTDSTEVQVAHWQTMIDSNLLALQNLEDFENKSLDAESIVSQTARPDYVAHGVAGVALASLEGSELEDFDDKYLVAGNDTTWVMQQAIAVPDLEDFANKSLDAESIVSQTARPDYVAHGIVNGVAAVNSEASDLEDFENKSLTTGNDSLVDATEIQVAHWQTMTELMNQYGMFTIDPDALAAAPANR